MIDLLLPEMDGITLGRRRQEDGFAKAPMVALSASPVMLQVATESHLFVRTLSKPFDLDLLLGCVARSLEASP